MRRLQLIGIAAFSGCAACAAFGLMRHQSGPASTQLFNGWSISPSGDHVRVGDMPLKVLVSPDGRQIVTSSIGFSGLHLTSLDSTTHQVIQDLTNTKVWNGLAFSPDGSKLYAGGGNSGKIIEFEYAAGKLSKLAEIQTGAGSFISGIAVQPTTGDIYVCNEATDQVYVVDPALFKLKATVSTGRSPHSCVLGEDPNYLYVSNWGGATVSVIDVPKLNRIRDISVGVRPNSMAVAADGRLFVACAGDNSVHVIQTRSLEKAQNGPTQATRPPEGVREVLNTALEPTALEGSSPVGICIDREGKRLFVANADNNDVMVADLSNPSETRIEGFIPTGWYPTCVETVGGQLIVATGKGLNSRANYPAQGKIALKGRQNQPYDYIGACFEGHLSFLQKPSSSDLATLTAKVRANTPFRVSQITETASKSNSIVPDHVGQRSPIQHILYVIMENRTYDQVFGDMKVGNSDPSLCMYGNKVTPNRHQLAADYVLMDNLYCNSEVSVDGHSWCDAGIATDVNQRSWTSSYSGHGEIQNADEIGAPTAGFLWDSARRHGLSVMAYGEGDSDYLGGHAVPVNNRGTWSGERDMDRADGWIRDLHRGEQTGQLSNLMIMSLGEDHTSGTRIGSFTPEASVASNDQAIGKIIEAATKSKFWNSMAIFFVEDDAQNGPDHVDAHRTFGLVVSPWVKRHRLISTHYTQVSMLRTIELLLGLPPLTQYDASAAPMFDVFTRRPEDVKYTLLPAETDLYAKNTPKTPGAEASAHMDLSAYDRAPEDELNRVLWAEAKGLNTPYPGVHHSFLK